MTPNPFAGIVVTASGTIPGQTHDDIKRMVEECGARFEKLNVTGCTHLITTSRYVQNATRKVDAVQKATNCDIVGIKWLVDSINGKHPVNTDGYLLKPAADDAPKSSQVTEGSPDSPESNKRKFEPEEDTIEEQSKVHRSNLHVHRKQLIALVDDRYDTHGDEIAVWMDEREIRWDAILINKLSKNPAGEMDPTAPTRKISLHRLQLLYNFTSGKFHTWFRLVDDKTEEGELHGTGDLKSALVEFKRLFHEQSFLSWDKRDSLPHGVQDWVPIDSRCIFFQPLSEEEKKNIVLGVQQAEVPVTIPQGVPGVLKVLFGHSNRLAVGHFFNDMARFRIKTVNHNQLDDNTLRAAMAILDKLRVTLAETVKRKTRNSPVEWIKHSRATYLKECYFGLLGICSRSSSEPLATDPDWLKQELQNLELMLKLRTTMDRTHLFGREMSSEVLQQAFLCLGLSEIKQVRKKTKEYDGLVDYLKMSVGSLHTVTYKEVINIFRIQRQEDTERYHQWRAANSDKIGQRLLLWHGSGCEKFIGILSQGLRVGLFEKSTSGMFGAGIYFADMSGKAARYCTGPSNVTFMLLCEVEIGSNPLNLQECDRTAKTTLRNEGKVGVVAHGSSKHKAWMNATSIHRRLDGIWMPDVSKEREKRGQKNLAYNEYVVYNPAQVQQRYLLHLKTG